MKLTRRKLATAVLLPAAAALAQTQPATPEDELRAARERMKSVGDALTQQSVPISTEPAFQFRA